MILIGLVTEEMNGRPLFTNPLKEPVLYKQLKVWVSESIEQVRTFESKEEG